MNWDKILEEIQVKKLGRTKLVVEKIQVMQPSEFGIPFCLTYYVAQPRGDLTK